ncbi:hypothetical protein D917_01722 [Trichinella nativa]|uniref:Uncharacterized protein n=1 Tax=Trichinella nativa TaxID=6335 RepID=A0A1Y3ELT9_9BILA|nr:hypothetical protein D917_01722 [Trichinella nativa]
MDKSIQLAKVNLLFNCFICFHVYVCI